jgi:hypothetical protein
MLCSCSGDHLYSPPAVLLWSWLFTMLVYWGLVSLPCPLSLGQGQWSISQPPAVSVLWWFAVCFSIFQSHWLWVILTGSGDELYGLLPALLQAVAYHPPTVGLSPFVICLLIVHTEISSFPFPFLWCTFRISAPSSVCLFSVLCLLFSFSFFFCGEGLVHLGGYAGLS